LTTTDLEQPAQADLRAPRTKSGVQHSHKEEFFTLWSTSKKTKREYLHPGPDWRRTWLQCRRNFQELRSR